MTVINPIINEDNYTVEGDDSSFINVSTDPMCKDCAYIETGLIDQNRKMCSIGVTLTVEQLYELSIKLEQIARDLEGGWEE